MITPNYGHSKRVMKMDEQLIRILKKTVLDLLMEL